MDIKSLDIDSLGKGRIERHSLAYLTRNMVNTLSPSFDFARAVPEVDGVLYAKLDGSVVISDKTIELFNA